MDPITSAVLSGYVYDTLKMGATFTLGQIQETLSDWLFDESVAMRMIEQIQFIPVEKQVSVEALTEHIDKNPGWQSILKEIKPARVVVEHNEGVVADSISGGKVTGQQNVRGDHIEVAGNYIAKAPLPKKS